MDSSSRLEYSKKLSKLDLLCDHFEEFYVMLRLTALQWNWYEARKQKKLCCMKWGLLWSLSLIILYRFNFDWQQLIMKVLYDPYLDRFLWLVFSKVSVEPWWSSCNVPYPDGILTNVCNPLDTIYFVIYLVSIFIT